MDEKELKEFANDICSCGIALSGIDYKYGANGDSHFDRLAKSLYGIGYQKIPEGAVVLSKEEYDDLKRRPSTREWVDTCRGRIEQTRKGTAREILQEFWKIQWVQSELDNVCIRLAKEYGVEVEK